MRCSSDIHLTAAPLFRDGAALAAARDLVHRHGYHRRDGELADAEAALVRELLTASRAEFLPPHRLPPPDRRAFSLGSRIKKASRLCAFA